MKSYKSQSFAVTGTGFFTFYSVHNVAAKFFVKNGAQPVYLYLEDTDRDAILLDINEKFEFEGPFESLHLKVVTSTNTSNVQIVEIPKF